jgi:hypothetical protein
MTILIYAGTWHYRERVIVNNDRNGGGDMWLLKK